MKCIILNFVFFIALFICFSSFGQLEKGTFVINENFGFYTNSYKRNTLGNSNNEKNNTTRYSSTTSFGYLTKENQEIGASLSFAREKYSQTDFFQGNSIEVSDVQLTYGIGIYYKRYITIIDKLSFYVSPQLNYSTATMNTDLSKADRPTTNSLGANIYTGLLYRPTKKFGLSMNLAGAGLNYHSIKTPLSKQNSFSLANSGGWNLALQFMF